MLYAKDIREAARQKLASYWCPAVVVALLYGILNSAVTATCIGMILLGGPLWYGYHTYWLERVRLQRPEIGTLFAGLSTSFGTSIAAYLLQGIFTFLWGLLFVIPGIIKGYSYALTPYLLADYPLMDALEAIDTSRAMMHGNKWRLFCLDMSFIGWYLLCAVTFGIAGLYVVPYTACARAQFYEVVKTEYEMKHSMQ